MPAQVYALKITAEKIAAIKAHFNKRERGQKIKEHMNSANECCERRRLSSITGTLDEVLELKQKEEEREQAQTRNQERNHSSLVDADKIEAAFDSSVRYHKHWDSREGGEGFGEEDKINYNQVCQFIIHKEKSIPLGMYLDISGDYNSKEAREGTHAKSQVDFEGRENVVRENQENPSTENLL